MNQSLIVLFCFKLSFISFRLFTPHSLKIQNKLIFAFLQCDFVLWLLWESATRVTQPKCNCGATCFETSVDLSESYAKRKLWFMFFLKKINEIVSAKMLALHWCWCVPKSGKVPGCWCRCAPDFFFAPVLVRPEFFLLWCWCLAPSPEPGPGPTRIWGAHQSPAYTYVYSNFCQNL